MTWSPTGPVASPSQTEAGRDGHTDLMTMSYLLMASPRELLRSRCPLPTTTQRRHLRLPWEEGAQTQAPPLLPELSCPGSAPALAQDPPQAPSGLVPRDSCSLCSPGLP